MLLAGAIGVVLAVVVLRETEQSAPSSRGNVPTTFRPAPTTVEELAEPGIVLPTAGEPPADAGTVQADAGDGRLRVRWGRAVSGHNPDRATGYQVSWGPEGRIDRHMLVAAPELELRGLSNGTRYDVEVRSIDAFGQRSAPIRGFGVPASGKADPWSQAFTGLHDDFRGEAPDPTRWAVQRIGTNCLRAGPGEGDEAGRFVLELHCGSSTAVLRSRIPLKLTDGDVRARIGLVTDAPVPGGQVAISLVPAPVVSLGVLPEAHLAGADQPGPTPEDPNLPPGTIRTVIGGDRATITTGLDVPRTGADLGAPGADAVLGAPGVTSRWELQLGAAGVTLTRDGNLAAAAAVRPDWTEATVLLEFTAPPGEVARLHLDEFGFTGPSSEPPNVVEVLDAVHPRSYAPGKPGPDTRTLPPMPAAQSAQLHVTMGPARDCAPEDLTADFGGPIVPLQPATRATIPANGPYCPLVAELPANIVDQLRRGVMHIPFLRSEIATALPVAGSFLEITSAPGIKVERPPLVQRPGPADNRERHRLPIPNVDLRNAAGEELVPGAPVERGRLVLDVALDGLTGQRVTGQAGGIAGIQVLLDNKVVAGLPTTRDGPAVGGTYRFGMATNALSPGRHVVEVRVYGTELGTRSRQIWINFNLR